MSVIKTKSLSVEVIEAEELTPEEQREPLSQEEQRDRLYLERKVERAFYEAGKALQSLRDRRLYRSTHKTFEEYCRSRFGYNRSRSYQFIDAATVVDNLQECPQFVDIFPTREAQVRPLTKLEPSQQRSVWQQAVESAGGKVPSGRVVKDIAQQIMERTKVPNPYRVGEVCQIIPKDNPELRGKGGYWCIVSEVHDFSCTVTAWDGEYTIALQHLKSKDYLDAECEEMKRVGDRISRLYSADMESAGRAVLKSLGELRRSYLTALEENLLEVLEEEYGSFTK